MIVLLGESGSGKSTIERQMCKYGMDKIVTYTTRPIREMEEDGVDYHFISEQEFRDLYDAGFFAENAIYNNWHYGIAKEDYTDDKVAVVTPHGFRQLKKNEDLNIFSFYIHVPRRDRMIKSLERGDDIEEIYRRSLSDIGQFDGIKDEVDCVINNEGYRIGVERITKQILAYVEMVDEERKTHE